MHVFTAYGNCVGDEARYASQNELNRRQRAKKFQMIFSTKPPLCASGQRVVNSGVKHEIPSASFSLNGFRPVRCSRSAAGAGRVCTQSRQRRHRIAGRQRRLQQWLAWTRVRLRRLRRILWWLLSWLLWIWIRPVLPGAGLLQPTSLCRQLLCASFLRRSRLLSPWLPLQLLTAALHGRISPAALHAGGAFYCLSRAGAL